MVILKRTGTGREEQVFVSKVARLVEIMGGLEEFLVHVCDLAMELPREQQVMFEGFL